MAGKYDKGIDRKSAFEILQARAEAAAKAAEQAELDDVLETQSPMEREFSAARRYSGSRVGRSSSRVQRRKDTFATAMTDAVIKELKGTTGRRIVRGILGGLFKNR